MNLTEQIQNLITEAETMKSAVGVNKKYINKTIDRLTDAWLYSQQLIVPGSLADRPEAQSNGVCICPLGAVDKTCPIHGA